MGEEEERVERKNRLSLSEGWAWVQREFPFEGYIPEARRESYFEMPSAVARWIPLGSKILDFGAGPCDKTALISLLGYDVTAFDDWGDDWYNFDDNRQKILEFSKKAGIFYDVSTKGESRDLFEQNSFDGLILNNVLEHLHDSPRRFLNRILQYVKDEGVVFVDVPNAGNLRKRLDLVTGRTNYPSFESYYWSSYPWRGHVREYVKGDLLKLSEFLGLERLALYTHHYHLEALPTPFRKAFILLCKVFPGFRESWMLVVRKPKGWAPRNKPSDSEAKQAFRRHYFKYEKEQIDWGE